MSLDLNGFCMRPHLCLLCFVYWIAFILVCSQSNCTFAPLCSLLSVLQCCSYSPLFSVSINLIVELPEYCYSILMRLARSVTVSNKRSGLQTTCSYVILKRAGIGLGSGTETMHVWTYLNNYSTVSTLKKHVGCFNRRVVTLVAKVSFGIINYCTKQPERQLLWSSYSHYPAA